MTSLESINTSLTNDDAKKSGEDTFINDLLLDFCLHNEKNFDAYASHRHATHTTRLYLQLAAGVELKKDTRRNLACDSITSPCLQILILVSSARQLDGFSARFNDFFNKARIIDASHDTRDLPLGFTHPVLVYFFDALITASPGKFFADFLANRLCQPHGDGLLVNQLLSHPTACPFAFRPIVKRIGKSSDLDLLIKHLDAEAIAGACRQGHLAVINELASVCASPEIGSTASQEAFFNLILTSMGFPASYRAKATGDPDPLIDRLIGLGCKGTDSDSATAISTNLNACLLVQSLLHFTLFKPLAIIHSICSQKSDKLSCFLVHPNLSHVLQAALKSRLKIRVLFNALWQVVNTDLTRYACHTQASHIVEELWLATDQLASSEQAKYDMAQRLIPFEGKLRSDKFGRFLYTRTQLDLFTTNRGLWTSRVCSSKRLGGEGRGGEERVDSKKKKARSG